MRLTQRTSIISIFIIQAVISSLLLIGVIIQQQSVITIVAQAAGTLVFFVLLGAYVHGWDAARHTAIILITLLTAFFMPEPYVSQQVAFSILVAPVLALIMAGPAWVVGSTAFILVSLTVRAGGGVYADPLTIFGISMVVVGMIVARLIADTAQRAAEENARRADQERARAEARAAELDAATHRLEQELERQRSLLALVETLETPVARLADGVLFAPVVGHLDTRRADTLMMRLLEAVHTQRARMMIVDIAGVPLVDTGVAAGLVRMVRGLRMLGCEVVVSGISAPVATSLVQLGASLGDIETVRSPQEALTFISARN
jgi:anti-anti-sigma regulatory factor/putative effector of murein hydrolase LrgA (UPF0299 family)